MYIYISMYMYVCILNIYMYTYVRVCTYVHIYIYVYTHAQSHTPAHTHKQETYRAQIRLYKAFVRLYRTHLADLGWLRSVGSIKLQVSFAKEPYKRANILQKRPIILSILLTVATPYQVSSVEILGSSADLFSSIYLHRVLLWMYQVLTLIRVHI